MSAPAVGAARAKPDPLASLMNRLPDPQDREWYAALVSYIGALPAEDELVKVAQLFGFLTLIGRELPEALALEQAKLRAFLAQAYSDLQQEVKTNARYHELLHERLSKLPGELAEGVKPEAIARAMSESFRQQLMATGIQETRTFLTDATRDLKKVAGDVHIAVKPLAQQYGAIAADIQARVVTLTSAATQLQGASQALERKNAQLQREARQLDWWIFPLALLLFLVVGAFFGVQWERRQSNDILLEIQAQMQQLQDSSKASPATLAPLPPVKRAKKSH